jgi:antitoxin (DNA-binding transcriptional repressor) of toxin-antitoxin stability system
MNTYTYSEARQKLSMVLNKAKKDGKVIIKRKDGTVFEIKAITENKSPLDVKGIKLNLKADEIINYIEDSRNSKRFGNITGKSP